MSAEAHNLECACALWSSPTAAQVAEAERAGILRVVDKELKWRSLAGAASLSFSLSPSSITRLNKSPDSKPEVKLRVVLGEDKSAPAYVVEFLGADAPRNRAFVIDWWKEAKNGPSVVAAPADKSPAAHVPVTGNLHQRLAQGSAAMRKGNAIGNDPLASFEAKALKESALLSSAQLRSQYKELVLVSAIVSDAEFWEQHKSELVKAALGKPKVGISSQVPDELRAKDTGDGRRLVSIDKSMMLSVFQKDPAIKAAYVAFVPLNMTMLAFWTAYTRSDEFRRMRRVGAAGSSSYSELRNPNVSLDDIASMTFADFFEAHRRGDFDGLSAPSASARAQGSSSFSSSSSASAAPASSSRDARSFDLVATVEDSVRAASLRETDSRAGYGTGESGRVYGLSELEARSLGVRDEDIGSEEARRQGVISSVNSYSRQVVDAEGASSFSSWLDGKPRVPQQLGASEDDGSAASLHDAAVRQRFARGIGASTANDLTDLYAPTDPSAGVAALNLDVARFQSALLAQGSGSEGAGGSSSSSSSFFPPAGGGGSIATPGRGSGSWTDLHAGASSSSFSDHHAAGSSSAAKRRRLDDASSQLPASLRDGGTRAAAEIPDVASPPPKPAPMEAFSKAGMVAAKMILRNLTQSAHDLFGATVRSNSGMSKSVPQVWRDYVGVQYGRIRELGMYLWAAVQSVLSRTPPLQEKRAKLRARLNADFDNLEAVKKEVLVHGARSLLPPADPTGAAVRSREVVEVEGTDASGNAATSELVTLLNMLQSYVHSTLLATGDG